MTDFTLNALFATPRAETVTAAPIQPLRWLFSTLGTCGAAYGQGMQMTVMAPFQGSTTPACLPDEDLEGRDPNW